MASKQESKCYCGAHKRDGKCPHECPMEASPAWLARQDAARAARDAYAARYESLRITAEDRRRMDRAMRRMGIGTGLPVHGARLNRKQRRRRGLATR